MSAEEGGSPDLAASPTVTPAAPGRHTVDVAPEDGGRRLDLLVAERLGLSRTQAATLVSTGQVVVAGKREKAGFRLRGGEVVVVEVPQQPGRELLGESIPLEVIFEDDQLIVVNKAAGMVVHPAPGNWSGTLVNALVGRGQDLAAGVGDERPGLVHRLDKDTSGLLIVAKNDRSHRLLSAAIADRRVIRRYAAASWGHLTTDRITVEKPIGRDPRDRKRMAIVQTGKAARTDFVRLARFDSGDLLRAHLHSGRTHQIRVHLASIGHPVLGDDTYGGGGGRRLVGLPPRRHFLHAAWLRFRHPVTGDALDLRAPLPEDLRVSLARMAADPALAEAPDPLAVFGFYDDDVP